MTSKKQPRTFVTGVRLTEAEREQLKRLGGGSLTDAIKRGINLLLAQQAKAN